jgi:hypothetical protein
MPQTNAERQAAWRARKRAAGQTIHPERDRRREQGRPARPERDPSRKPWLMIDTEGADDPAGVYGDPGRQWTMLICAASDDGFERALYTGKPLTTSQMLQFIAALPREYRIGGYYLGYDYSQLLHQMPAEALQRLIREQLPVAYMGRFVLGLFNTQLRLVVPNTRDRRGVSHDYTDVPDDIRQVKGTTRTVWDVGRFYNSRLTTALENWAIATPAEQAFLERMKAQRSVFDLELWDAEHEQITRYSLLENKLTARLQTRFDATMAELGYPLTSWYGAGSAAKAMLTAHKIREHLDQRAPLRRPKRGPAMVDYLADAYFGGRFEIQAPGRYAPVHEYDICSAYPAAYRESPCLVHGAWTMARDREQIGPADLFLVDWQLPPSHVWGPFPHRQKNGTICYPDAGTEHAVWGVELQAAREIWGDQIRIVRRWAYRTRCDCRLFDWINDVYAYRKKVGKTAKGYTLRISMNAIYGTLASALGAELVDGQIKGWCEPRWSSLYTAWTRAKLLEALRLAGGAQSRDVIMFATDAIYTTRPIDGLPIADELGAWEHHEYPDGGLLIQPGLYHFHDQDVVSKLRGRGIAFADLQHRIDAFYAAYDRDGAQGAVTLKLTPRYIGVRLALAQNNLAKAWRWASQQRTIRLDPSAKRTWRIPDLQGLGDLEGDLRELAGWFPREAHELTGPAPHPIFSLLLNGVDTGVPTVPPDAQLEAISADEQPSGPAAL